MPLTKEQIELIEATNSQSSDALSIIQDLASAGDFEAITDAIKRHSESRSINKADKANYLAGRVLAILANVHLPTDAAWIRASLTLRQNEPNWEENIASAARYGGLRGVVEQYRDAVNASLLS